VCDQLERCTGSSTSCPTDLFLDRSTICRPTAGDCDIEEQCPGTSASCPDDALQPPRYVCRPALDPVCDYEEVCSGVEPRCPDDGFAPMSTNCGSCDGKCDGRGACFDPGCCATGELDCDMDGTCESCNAASGPCDYRQVRCTGVGAGYDCGPDRFIPAGEPCRGMAGICDGAGACRPV